MTLLITLAIVAIATDIITTAIGFSRGAREATVGYRSLPNELILLLRGVALGILLLGVWYQLSQGEEETARIFLIFAIISGFVGGIFNFFQLKKMSK